MQEPIKTITFTAQEAAAYIGVSYWLILELAKRKQIKHIRAGTGRGIVLFRKESLDEWLSSKEDESVKKLESAKIRRIKA